MGDRLTEENVGKYQQGTRKASTSTQRSDFPINLTGSTLKRTSKPPISSRKANRQPSHSTISAHDPTMYHHSPLVKKEPTYKMAPDDKTKFNVGKVERLLQPLLESYLDGRTYEAKECAHLSKGITEAMKTRIKDMNFHRYKIIVNVTIGQNRRQGFSYSSRELWNPETDNYATVCYQNSSLFAIATVFATYYE